MTRSLIYVVGEPGAGKSTAVAKATAHLTRHPQQTPLAHDLLVDESSIVAIELGKRRQDFSGTDALPMNAITKAEGLLADTLAPVVIGEGARLGVRRFFETAVGMGYDVTLFYLTTPHAAEQRAARGTEQKDSWVKGAATRAANIAAADIPGVKHVTVNGAEESLANILREHITDAIWRSYGR